MTINDKIAALRAKMQENQLDAYLIPSSDPHQSEYVAPHWKCREWISGFTGSAGLVIVTTNHAGLWTDSRYFIQAEEQLAGSEMVLHKQNIPHAPEHVQWLKDNLKPNSTLGCNGRLLSKGQIQYLANRLQDKDISIDYRHQLLNEIWQQRPPLPTDPVFEHDIKYAGKSRLDKLNLIRTKMRAQGVAHHLVTTLDDIAWVLNLRGSDVAYNPVCICYLVIGLTEAHLFINPAKVPEVVKTSLKSDGVQIHPYLAIEFFLDALDSDNKVLVDVGSINMRLYEAIPGNMLKKGPNLIRPVKAIKNEQEIGHIKNAMQKDARALTHLFMWLEKTLDSRTISEVEVAKKLEAFRAQEADYFGESFGAIVGFNGNGAIVHYRAEEGKCAHIQPEGILLLDSGGQYLDGTTDITRTIALGQPTDEQKRHFTLVLKGHIGLATIRFPNTTSGAQLDTLARMYLWQDGLNYGHGTGHGVGFFLNVHEPPQGFASSAVTSRGSTVFQPGMLTSNEPGFYKSGNYGIRTENLVLCVEDEENEWGNFLKFETLTLFPIDKNLIDASLLSTAELEWLNYYHQNVWETMAPQLDEESKDWMKVKCAVLQPS